MTHPGARTLHEGVAEGVRDAIASGRYAPGEQIPAEDDLARDYRVSRATVRRALETLTSEGLLTAGYGRAGRRVQKREVLTFYGSRSESMARADERRGRGVDAWVADAADQGRTATQSIRVMVEFPPAMVAGRLELGEGEAACARKRVRYLDGVPHNLNTTWYPLDIAEGSPIMSPADVAIGTVALMREMGYVQVRYVDEMEARTPTPAEAEQLRMPPGWPVLTQLRTGYTTERPVKVTLTIWPADRARLVYELGA